MSDEKQNQPSPQDLMKKGLENLTPEELKNVADFHYQALFNNLDPFANDDKDEHCIMCKWTGKRGECKLVEVNSPPSAWRALAGREGYEWKCPKCGFTVARHYTKMS